ncbi:hypothetical protein [Lentzea sp. E54]|uniref:hypothetical protein n=1 Tax=Lentzea xerophila TaxID=3435883 RepID=UPI003DA40B77
MKNTEIAVGLLVTWMTRSSISGRDLPNDQALALRTVHELVTAKLSGDPALKRLEVEASDAGEVRPRTRTRLEMALEDAAEDDRDFAKALEKAVSELRSKSGAVDDQARGAVINRITGNVSGRVIQARDIHGSVTFHDDSKRR